MVSLLLEKTVRQTLSLTGGSHLGTGMGFNLCIDFVHTDEKNLVGEAEEKEFISPWTSGLGGFFY